ncbi:von Willebrand factor D and EGF domain-containing protein-like [Gigantopelta aegis]|uniref:von Willebrand factor D and EGF domain-containing protein-like n=1 Tax=Gigantopelta aegis TaxID=1735272 RepID=UPI001B88B6E3|nr:von Willebrand factor D and EGF domain-containing protein-like [Gigantopelta aegis]
MAITLLIGFICVVCYKVSLAGDPCENFKVFPNEILRNTSYESGSSGRISDQYITEDWYGSLKEFPTDPPGVNKCGTSFPVWAKEEVIADDGSINVTMCTQIPGNECIESFIIHGKKCDNFKIYYLKRTGTDSAYCLDATKEAAPEQVMKPVVNPDLIQLTNNDALIFRCTFDKSTADVFYKIYWYVENKTLPSSQPHKWIDREKNNVLNETTIKDHGWDRVGFHVYCSVRSSYKEQSAESLPIFSDAKYVGIKLYNTTVHLHSEAIKIFFKLTAPFGCLGGTECSLHIQLLETESNPDKTCTRQNLVASDCGIKVKKGDWDNIQSITIKGRNNVDKYKDKTLETVMKLTTSPSNWNHGIWANYTDFGYVVIVTTTNTSKIEGKMCRAVCDPHMTTLDGKWYEHQYEGIFTLYANVKLEAEVQVETAPCGLAFCICGLVVRAGRTVFAIEQCHRQRNIDFLFCDDEDDVLDVRRRSSTQYEILFPSGTIVKANLLNYGSYFMDIYVVPSVHDVDNSRGLCGKLSDTDTDDFVKRNGSVSEFSESWSCIWGAV